MAGEGSQSLFNKPDLEGFLEKAGTGITSKFLSAKTKVWCELHGAVLNISKENKRVSASGPQHIDMRAVQMVRKASSDKSGNSFEIISNNKAQVFTASSAQECSVWIQHLQRGMTMKDQNDIVSTPRRSITVGDYEDVITGSRSSTMQVDTRSGLSIPSCTASTNSDYAEVEFQNAPPVSPTSKTPTSTATVSWLAEPMENYGGDGDDYAVIGVRARDSDPQEVVLRSSVAAERFSSLNQPPASPKPLASPTNKQATNPPATPTRKALPPAFSPPAPPTSPPPANSEPAEEYGYCSIAGANAVHTQTVADIQPYSAATATNAETGDIDRDQDGYTQVKPRASRSDILTPETETPSRDAGNSSNVDDDNNNDDNDDDDEEEDAFYEDVLSLGDTTVPIPNFPSPLKEEDEQPLSDLQEFLSNNRRICRPSFRDTKISDDPIGDMKKLLLTLHV